MFDFADICGPALAYTEYLRFDIHWYVWAMTVLLMIIAAVSLGGSMIFARLHARTARDVKHIRQSLENEFDKYGFISIQRMREFVTIDRIRLQLVDVDKQASQAVALAMTKNASKLLSILIFQNEQAYFQALFEQSVDDTMFSALRSEGKILSSEGKSINFPKVGPTGLQGELCENQWKIPPPYVEGHTQHFPSKYKPPFYSQLRIGSGGNGEVYKVEVGGGHLPGHTSATTVAMKRIPMSGADRKTFLREADTLRARKHPHIIPLLASYTKEDEYSQGILFLLGTYAVGGDMEVWLKSTTTPQYPSFLGAEPSSITDFIYKSIFSLVSALAYVHSEINGEWTGHRDLKPRNILLFDENGVWLWKLADFGHSHLKSIYDESGTDRIMGSFEYQPPEIRSRGTKYYTSFDVFSMGCIIVELATMMVFADWENNRVVYFRNLRLSNDDPIKNGERPEDASFRNNMHVVKKWIGYLKKQNGSENLQRLLDVALAMMEPHQKDRLLAFDAALDIWELVNPEGKGSEFKTVCEKVIEGQRPNSVRFGPCYDPVLRSKRRPAPLSQERARIRQECLVREGWADTGNSTACKEGSTVSKTGRSFSNLPNVFRGDVLYGREHQLTAMTSSFKQDAAVHVGLYGLGGTGKSHVAWKHVSSLRDKMTATGKVLHTFWVQAQNKSVFEASYSEIATKIGVGVGKGQSITIEVREWLQDPDNGPWVLVLDGMEENHPEWVSHCPWRAGNILITTRNRAVASYFCERDSNIIELGTLGEEDGGRLLQHFSGDSSPHAQALASKLCLPILIKTMGLLIHRDKLGGRSIASMNDEICGPIQLADFATSQELRRPWSEMVNPDTQTIYDILFTPLKQGQQYRFLRSTFRLMCFLSNNNINEEILKDEFKPGGHIEIYSGLTNLCYLTDLSNGQYSIHEAVQSMFLRWVASREGGQTIWNGYLRTLQMLGGRYQSDKKAQAQNSNDTDPPRYLLKLRYKIHVEEFLKYLKSYPEGTTQYPIESLSSVITFARMLRDENRFEDSGLLLRDVLQRGIMSGSTQGRLQTQLALIETYRASASGRFKMDVLDKALEQANKAIREAEDAKDLRFNRRICAARVDILHDQQKYEAAAGALAPLMAIKTSGLDEDHKALLSQLRLKAKIERSQGLAECKIEFLRSSRELCKRLREEILKSSYSHQVKKELTETARKEEANTCLTILTVMHRMKSTDADLGRQIYQDAYKIYDDIKSDKEDIYRRENQTFAEHKHVRDAEVNIGAVNLRYGTLTQNQLLLEDSRKTFRRILDAYGFVDKLSKTDKDVKICAYLLRQALHVLTECAQGDSQYALERGTLEAEYDLKPWN